MSLFSRFKWKIYRLSAKIFQKNVKTALHMFTDTLRAKTDSRLFNQSFLSEFEQKCFCSFVYSTFQESSDPVENCNEKYIFPGKKVET